MYISKLEITNYCNFKHLVLEKLPPTVVFVGENGIGKSNLLEAVRLVLDPALPDTARVLKAHEFWDGLKSAFAGYEIRVVVELRGFDSDTKGKALLCDCIVNKKPLVARLTYVYRPFSSLPSDEVATSREDDYEFRVFGGVSENVRVGPEVRRHVSVQVLPVLRDPENDLQTWSRTPLRPLLQRLKIPDAELKGFAKSISNAAVGLEKHEAIVGLNEALTSRLKGMVGELFSVKTKLAVAATLPDQLLRSIRLMATGVHDRGIGELSLGTASLIFLVLLLENLQQRRTAGEIVTTILAVEEPEAHLHPTLQRLLFGHLLRLKMPMLLTSHSTHVASVTPLRSLVTLRHSAKAGTVGFTTREAGLTTQQVLDLERYLDVTRAEMLFARAVILVEGPAEMFIIPAFASLLGHDLQALGVVVSAVHGTDFAPYRSLLGEGGLNIPHVIVTDGDPNAKDATALPAGIARGIRLTGKSATLEKKLDGLATAGKFPAARTALREDRCFVGIDTLEVDLLPEASAVFKKTYRELVTGKVARANFKSHVDETCRGDAAARSSMLKRIEKVGKGRFAQRLAGLLEVDHVPSYIQAAIESVVEMVKTDARN